MNKQYLQYIIESEIKDYLIEVSTTMNVASVSTPNAFIYSKKKFKDNRTNIHTIIPKFKDNYKLLQQKTKNGLGIKRSEMPVIEPQDIKTFKEELESGKINIFKPNTNLKLINLNYDNKTKSKIHLHSLDETESNGIEGKIGYVSASKLKPTQNQIWLEKLINNFIQYGEIDESSEILNNTIIISKEGYILDGHHRYGQVMLSNPELKIKCLLIPLDINTLIEVGNEFSNRENKE